MALRVHSDIPIPRARTNGVDLRKKLCSGTAQAVRFLNIFLQYTGRLGPFRF